MSKYKNRKEGKITKLLALASIIFLFASCTQLSNTLGNSGSINAPSNSETPPSLPAKPAEPNRPPIPPVNPDEPETPPAPPVDPGPDEPENPDNRPLCPTIVENETLKAISAKYPAYAIGVGNFVVHDESIPNSTTDRAKAERLKITAQDRERILGIFGIIRFVVNSEEFEKNFMDSSRSYPSGDTLSYHLGSVTKGKQLDKERYLEVIRKLNFNIGITKKNIGGDLANVAGGHPFIYLHFDTSWAWDKNQRKVEINLPNFISWSEPIIGNRENEYARDAWLATLLFHESLHIAGFSHLRGNNSELNRNDAIYSVEQVFKDTYTHNDAFRAKYANELAELSQYYKDTYVNWINYDTLIYPNDEFRPSR